MENLEENNTEACVAVEVAAVEIASIEEEKQSLFFKYSWSLGLLASILFIFSSVFVYKKFLKEDYKPVISSKAIERKIVERKISETFTEKRTIKKGATIGKILSSYDVSYQSINKILKAASSQKIDLTQLKPGQVLKVRYVKDKSQIKALDFLSMRLNKKSKLKITQDQKTNEFKASIIPIALTKEVISFGGKIKDSLMVSAIHAGVPISNLIEATNACSYEVDFQRDIRNGNSFKMLIEKFTSEEDGSTFFGKTVYFSLKLNNRKYRIYKFKPKNGTEEFFTERNQSAKRGLLKTPIPIVRITSRFGRRKHPILGYSIMHRGVDFGAPIGTSIYSAGNGTVLQVGRDRGLGNFVKIRHNSKLVTVYGHISRFAKNLKKGIRVKQGQVIAFVGKTGRATGPHLHYEIRVRGRHVNPLKFKLPSMKILRGQDIKDFKSHRTYVNSLLKNKLFS
jgi:murein DD-endopeptidase MepM/ murein hydrolase activator NlpD